MRSVALAGILSLCAGLAAALASCSSDDDDPASDAGGGGKGTGGKASTGGKTGSGGWSEAGSTGGTPEGGGFSSEHGPGDRCGGLYGPCNAGLSCRSRAVYDCVRATRAPCPNEVGFCYPEDVAGCNPNTMGGTFFPCASGALPLGTPKPDETCCAPLGDKGAHACKVPDGTTPGCETCTELSGDQYSAPSCDGGACGRIVATDVIPAVGLAADDAGLYWNSREYDLMALDSADGTTRVLASDVRDVDSIATDGTYLYVGKGIGDTADTMGISRLPLGGGELTPFAPDTRVDGQIFVAGDFVYWRTLYQRLAFKPRAGGSESVIEDLWVDAAAAGADSVFIRGNELGQLGKLWSAPLGSGTYAQYADTTADALTATETHVYWLQSEATPCGLTTSLVRKPLGGGAAATLTRTRRSILDLTVSADSAYYSAANPEGGAPGGAIVRVPLDGGPARAVVETVARDILVRDRTLYWIDSEETLRALDLD